MFNVEKERGASIEAIGEEIHRWEREHCPPKFSRPLRFGFDALHVDEIEKDQRLIDQLDRWLRDGEALFAVNAAREIKRYWKNLRKNGKFHDDLESKYLSAAFGDGTQVLRPSQWVYFKTYFILTKLIFGPLIPEAQLTTFISNKVIREHFELPWVGERFTPAEIGNRMRRTKVAERNIKSRLHSSGLVGRDIEQFVHHINNNIHLLWPRKATMESNK